MNAAMRWVSGVLALGGLAAAGWMLQAEPARRSWTAFGATFTLSMPVAALWVSQLSFLCFAASRRFRSRALGRPPRAWEASVLKAARPVQLGALALPAAWAAWSLFARRG